MPQTIGWRRWARRAFEDAAAERKPVLFFLVVSWSDACAAMDADVYGNSQVAAIVNERFIPVREDADARPDLNDRYNMGGWPSTAWLTPEGRVLSGVTYVDPEQMVALLNRVADAWRDRHDEIVRAGDGMAHLDDSAAGGPLERAPDRAAVSWFRAILIDQFDPDHGGFGVAPKFPHVSPLLFALALADEDEDEELRQIVEVSLDRLTALWDRSSGGFYRCAEAADWTSPATEKTLEDNTALLGLYLEASIRLQSEEYGARAADIVRWLKGEFAHAAGAGFLNSQAAGSRAIDPAIYVDRNADAVSVLLRAAALFDDPWLRDFAIASLETVVVAGYVPGGGVAHQYAGGAGTPQAEAPIRGLLVDQVRAASALIWAHVLTGQLPYSMLAAELMHFAVRAMWDERARCFRDRAGSESNPDIGLLAEPVMPFALNCDAACVLDRLAALTGDDSHRERALAILGSLAVDYQPHGLSAAPYALAVREIIDGHRPPGLVLSRVDWDLDYSH